MFFPTKHYCPLIPCYIVDQHMIIPLIHCYIVDQHMMIP